MTYNPGQVEILFPYIEKLRNIYPQWTHGYVPKWFILGGPSDADEAQCMVKRYPWVEVLGIEPIEEARVWQMSNGFKGEMVAAALSDKCGEGEILFGGMTGRSSTMVPEYQHTEPMPKRIVKEVTLDSLSEQYGPFNHVVLWLDIEGMEYRALMGATQLLKMKAIDLINVEMMIDRETREDFPNTKLIDLLLEGHGFKAVETWDVPSGNHYDKIYIREG